MPATISIELRERLLRAYFRRDIQLADEQLYCAVTNAVPLANSVGEMIDEPTLGSYSRAPVNLNADNWGLTGFGEIQNQLDIIFPDPVIGEDWGYLGGWALLDAPTAGVTLAVGSLVVPTYYTGDMPTLALSPGAITIALYD